MTIETGTMNANRLGLRQGGSDDLELFKVEFAGDILNAFETMVKFRDKQRIRVLQSGKAANFPAIFKATTEYHTPGAPLTGLSIPSQDIVVNIDDKLVSHVFIADIDEAMAYFDVRAPYSTEIGNALALAYDKNVIRTGLLAARGGELFTGDGGGSTIHSVSNTDGNLLLDAMGAARQTLDEKDVPVDTTQVFGAVKPAQFYLIAAVDRALNKLYGGDGSAAKGVLNCTYGVEINKSNAVPFGKNETPYDASTNATGLIGKPTVGYSLPTKYQGDWTHTNGLVWTEAAIATAQLRDLAMEMESSVRYQGTLMVGKYIVGHGTLRNKCAVELNSAASGD